VGMVGEITELQQVAAHKTGPSSLLKRGPGGFVGAAAPGPGRWLLHDGVLC
jgi:hypothetical protein